MKARIFMVGAALCTLLALSGCAGILGRLTVTETPLAAADKAALSQINPRLTAFKGLGKIGFEENGVKKSFRVAFMASGDSRLRMDVLPIPGNSGASFSTDGRLFYIQDRRPGGAFMEEEASTANLRKLISIDITPEDVISLLAGRPPIRSHDAAVLSEKDPSTQKELRLVKGWGRTVEKIRYQPDGRRIPRVLEVSVMDPMGKLVWDAELGPPMAQTPVPGRLVITDAEQRRVTLEIQRFWPNPQIDPGGFVLSPP